MILPNDKAGCSNSEGCEVGKKEGVNLVGELTITHTMTQLPEHQGVFFLIMIVERELHCQLPCFSSAPMPLRGMLTNISVTVKRSAGHKRVVLFWIQLHLFYTFFGGGCQRHRSCAHKGVGNATLEWILASQSWPLECLGCSSDVYCTEVASHLDHQVLEGYLWRTREVRI